MIKTFSPKIKLFFKKLGFMFNTTEAAITEDRTLRRFKKATRKLLLRYLNNPALVKEIRDGLKIPTDGTLSETEMKKLEMLFNTIKTNNVAQEKD